ncbi:MAG TPA: MurR/RpiR family transcriptional regulator [Terriglobales bacterium]|nr:MurR/RpiR family transcriptional regulator [Terriglobales bacterium]
MARSSKRTPTSTSALSLSSRLDLLSPKRRETVRPAVEHPRDFVLLSIRALAERLKTDPATMVRIVRAMQFGSYREFQHYLHALSIAHATSIDTMQTIRAGSTSIRGQARASLEQDQRNLEALMQGLEPARIANLARRIYNAHRIVIIGGDLAANLVQFLQHHLIILNLPVVSATTPGEVVHRVRFLGKKDVAIAISFRRGLRQTVEGLRQARTNGAYCVGITDTLVSPLGQFAHECFLASVDTPSFGASYVAPMGLLNVIVVACANYRRSRTMSILKKVEQEQRHGFRWYET